MTTLTALDFVPDFPDHELIVYRNVVVQVEDWLGGFECLIAIPKQKIAERAAANPPLPPPFWRHGEVMNVRPRGPASWNLWMGFARTPREKARAEVILSRMLARGEFVKFGGRRDAKYGVPKGRRR